MQVLWFVYNDQGDAKCLGCGHTKGIVAGDEAGGLWLVHSIPHFIHGVYPVTGLKFGQSALCISLGQAMLNSVGRLLMRSITTKNTILELNTYHSSTHILT